MWIQNYRLYLKYKIIFAISFQEDDFKIGMKKIKIWKIEDKIPFILVEIRIALNLTHSWIFIKWKLNCILNIYWNPAFWGNYSKSVNL